VAIVSLIALAGAFAALYKFHLAGGWRRAYVICSVVALYFNCFVLVVQSFEKVPALNAMAPTQTEAPFAIAQLAVLGLFVWAGIQAARRFRVEPPKAYSAYSGG
jgi:hypothetical protein